MIIAASGTNPSLYYEDREGMIWVAFHNGTQFVLKRYANVAMFRQGQGTGTRVIATAPAGPISLCIGNPRGEYLLASYKDAAGNLIGSISRDDGQTWE